MFCRMSTFYGPTSSLFTSNVGDVSPNVELISRNVDLISHNFDLILSGVAAVPGNDCMMR